MVQRVQNRGQRDNGDGCGADDNFLTRLLESFVEMVCLSLTEDDDKEKETERVNEKRGDSRGGGQE